MKRLGNAPLQIPAVLRSWCLEWAPILHANRSNNELIRGYGAFDLTRRNSAPTLAAHSGGLNHGSRPSYLRRGQQQDGDETSF